MNAFMVRMHPVGIDRVPVARVDREISVGWGKVGTTLLDRSLSRASFGQAVHDTYYANDGHRMRSGRSASTLWRFIHSMRQGDLVLIPHADVLHVAGITGEVTYDPSPGAEHWAYRRPVRWLTGEHGVPRAEASEALRRRARTQLTCLDITDLAADVRNLV